MRGSVRTKSKGNFQIQIYTGQKDANGKPKRYFEPFHGKMSDAQIRLRELLASLDKGIFIPSSKTTVADNLHQWFEGYVKTNCSIRTQEGYQSIIDIHLIPALGSIKLKALNAQVIARYYGDECAKLSALSVHHFHRVLSQSLKYAVRQGYLGRNPAEMVDPPSPRRKTMRTLTTAEVETLLDKAAGNYYYPVFYTAVSSGLRQAELSGLRWRDLDLDYMSISVNQVLYKRRGICEFKEPKTAHSRRRVDMTPKLAIFLREYKADRESLYRQLDKDKPLSLDDLVFTSVHFKPIEPADLSREFRNIVKKANLGKIRFHDLRHTFASLMLLKGVNPKVVSEALGHSSVGFTLDVYSHIIGNMQSNAMALLNDVLPEGKNKGFKIFNASLTPQNNITQSEK